MSCVSTFIVGSIKGASQGANDDVGHAIFCGLAYCLLVHSDNEHTMSMHATCHMTSQPQSEQREKLIVRKKGVNGLAYCMESCTVWDIFVHKGLIIQGRYQRSMSELCQEK